MTTHEIHAVEVNGRFYNHEKGMIDYNALCNYRYATENIVVVTRCRKGRSVGEGWLALNGEGVRICPIPELDLNSPLKVLLSIPGVIKQGLRAISSCDRYMVRLPGPTGVLMALLLRLRGKKYAVELAGDPAGVFKLTKNFVPFQRVYDLFAAPLYKHLIKHAYCVGYRSDFIRRLYQNKSREHEWVFSGAQLSRQAIGSPRGPEWFRRTPFKIIFVGRIFKEKGVVHLLEAFSKLCATSPKATELHFVGDGPELGRLREEADQLGLINQVYFHGRVKRGLKLFALLDESHCFVLPTFPHYEGLPRALIEAMARGVPSFASDVDAIPELLDKGLLFPPFDSDAIAKKILAVIDSMDELAEISTRCFEASKAHWPQGLAAAKQGFWGDVMKGCK
jgi:glycosyltransferase involved in cell wall biosynthesis